VEDKATKLSESSRFKGVARVSLLVAALVLVGPAWDMIKNIFARSAEAGAAGKTTVNSAFDGTMLADLAKPQEGRSMRATSTMRVRNRGRSPILGLPIDYLNRKIGESPQFPSFDSALHLSRRISVHCKFLFNDA
jgi:hypothetical protein